MSAEQATAEAPDGASKSGGLSTKAKVFIGLGVYLGDRDPDVPDLRQLRQKRKLPAPERVQTRTVDHARLAGIDISINKAVLYLFLASALTIGTMLWISKRMQQKPNRVQTAIEVAYDMTKNTIAGGNLDTEDGPPAGSPSWPRSSSGSGSRT